MRSFTFDKLGGSNRSRSGFKTPREPEVKFYSALRKVAEVTSHIVGIHVNGVTIQNESDMLEAIESYVRLISPWANLQAKKMVERVSTANARAFSRNSHFMAKLIKSNVVERDVGQATLNLINEHVELIKSIPREAALRAQRIAFEAATTGKRAVPDQETITQFEKQLGMTKEVAVNRAKLIAVTETARASATLNQVRASAVGSKQYIWRNSGDGAVRESHREYHGRSLDGMVFNWDNPPTLSDGTRGHPGTFPRCRCYAEPIF